MVAQIGGYVALLWLLIRFMFNGYESFKLSNSIIGSMYTVTVDGGKEMSQIPPDEDPNLENKIRATLSQKQKNWYSYSKFRFAELLESFCCCLKNRDFYKRRVGNLKIFKDA